MNHKLFKVLLITALLALVIAPTAVVAQSSTNISFANSTGLGQSNSTILINNIRVDFVTTNPFDPAHPTIQTVPFNVPFVFDPTTLHLVPNVGGAADTTNPSAQCANLTVTVRNASTGSPLSGAVITVGSATATADTLGLATLSGLLSGSASVSATAANFTATSRTIDLTCTAANSIGIALSPTGSIAVNQVRIVLSWGANPSDLDSHLTGPSSASTGSLTDTTNRFHLYYAARTQDVSRLDVDDTSGFGPETITISPPTGSTTLRPGLYRYSVFHYSGTSNIRSSPASVTLYLGSQQREFIPSTASTAGTLISSSGALWTVFELAVSSTGGITVYPVNTYSTLASASSGSAAVRSTETGYGDIERGIDFARLPPK